MLQFSMLLLRSYYRAIGWNEDNSYSQLTRSSSALLDFQVPQSLVLQLANAPTPIFFTSYALDALPQLNGSISYLTSSEPLADIGPSSSIPFRHVVERFRIFPSPHRPLPKDEVWQGGRRVEGRDYMLYSRVHLPSLHLSGLATTRITPTLQAHLAFLSQPSPPSSRPTSPSSGPSHSRQPSSDGTPNTPAASPAAPGNVLLSLQHDTGKYSGEYTYSAQDGMFGFRGLYNFGWIDPGSVSAGTSPAAATARGAAAAPSEGVARGGSRRIDDDEMMEGGLRGRFSAGGEVYFSAKQRSFGISTGMRFTTLPHTLPPGSQAAHIPPPTTLTLLYNPLIGFISSAYSAQVSPTVALSTRFGVNVYSYESDLSIGGECFIGRGRGKRGGGGPEPEAFVPTFIAKRTPKSASPPLIPDTMSLRPTEKEQDGNAELQLDSSSSLPSSHAPPRTTPFTTPSAMPASAGLSNVYGEPERDGVLKARMSGNWSVALLYEARIRNCLVSLGFVSDLLSRQRPIRSVGLEVQYFS